MAKGGSNNHKETAFSAGDIVWASPYGGDEFDEDHKEPGSIVKVDCAYEDDDGNEYQNGIMVKFQVSNTRVVVAPAAVRPYKDNDTQNGDIHNSGQGGEKQEGKRRSTRASRSKAATVESPPTQNTTAASKNQGGVKSAAKTTKASRALVTPSPTVATASTRSDSTEDVIMEEEEKEDSKKRTRSVDRSTPTSKKRAVSQPKNKKGAPKSKAVVAKEDTEEKEDNDDDNEEDKSVEEKMDVVESPYFDKTKNKRKANDKKEADDEDEDDDSVDVPLVSLKNKESTAANKKPAAKKKAPAKPTTTKKAAAKKPKAPEVVEVKDSSGDDDSSEEDDDDKPYQAEYAPSGRSTCRRCDEVITKGSLRLSHVPLFRGKPGFRVYRHLECMVLSEDIQYVEQIGGWKKIRRQSKEDFQRLCLRVEESKLEREEEEKELQPDELVQVTFQGEMRGPPKGLVGNLLPFQVEGVSWMYHQEVKLPELHGGILADEMGMGKTLQTITTILDNRPQLQHSKPGAKHPPSITGEALESRKRESDLWDASVIEWKNEMKMINVPPNIHPKKFAAARAGTLVICPVIALLQWKTELEKFTEPGTFSIATYHGPNRAKEYPIQKLLKYDIVLTTYQVLEQDFRKMVSPNKVSCPNCGGKFKIDKLRVHLTYFCGDGAERTEAQMRQQRSAPRQNRGGNEGRSSGKGAGNSKVQKKKSFSKPAAKKSFSKPAAKKSSSTTTKKTPEAKKYKGGKAGQPIRATGEDDSDEEDDCAPMTTPTGGRPSRSAAVSASKRLSASKEEWGTKGADDDESFGSESDESDDDDDDDDEMSYDDEDSDGEAIPSKMPAKRAPAKKKARPKKIVESEESDSDSESSEEDDAALVRARKKQAAALKQAKQGKNAKKPLKKGGKPAKGKAKGKKKFHDEDSSDSSDESESEDEKKRDPLEGIDLDALMEAAMEGSCMSILHSVCWWRVVLDEAHMIKSRSSQTAAAAFSLVGINRWALSGTPLQNRVGELYSLIRFLRIEPMAHYFCRSKGCGCKSIHYRIKNGVCLDCNHRGFQHFSHFNKHVLNPIQRDGYSGDGRRAMFKLKNEVLDKVLLRRTKETRAEDMNLPPRIVSIRTIQLHPAEKDFYNALYTQTKSSFSDYVEQGTLLNNYAHIFDLLTRMRQAVDHPYLIVYSKRNCDKAARESNDSNQPLIANGSTDCDICQELPTGRIVSTCCGAAFCRSCVLEYVSTAVGGGDDDVTPCPSCRAPFSIDLNQAESDVVEAEEEREVSKPKGKRPTTEDSGGGPSLKELSHVNSTSILKRINLSEFATSTKIEALVQELVEMRKSRPGSKALVFSQFVNMLDLIRWRIHCDPCLSEMGLGVRILHGSMDVKSRDAALKDFREDGSVRVLLMSLKAGGVALNLTVASEVFLVDNWWNPAAEMQAIDRTHRLGQHRCIRAVRFIAEGTVEERVLQLQEKKRLVFDGTVGRDAGSLKMLTVNDMKALFQ